MEATILNTNFESIDIVDSFKSFLWTDRYDQAGDFEIYIPIKDGLPDNMAQGNYLWNPDSEHTMIIECISIDTDVESGACFVIAGKSLEHILSRRIIWNKTVFKADDNTDNFQNAIERLLNENVINPAIAARKIPNFIFTRSTDERITKLTLEAQYYGEDLYDTICKLCQEHKLGFKIVLNDADQFEFSLYAGIDRSYEQTENPYVVFSPEFDNIFNSSYIESDLTLKNVTLVAGETEGEGENETRTTYVVELAGFHTGLDRREIFTDASGVSSDDGDGGTLSVDQYQACLKMKGIDTLIDNTATKAFEGEVDATRMFVYGEDFFLGDVVQLTDEYGHEGSARVSELVMSHDSSGVSMYPTFTTIQEGEYDAHE